LRLRLGVKGFEALPIALLVSVLLGACTLSLGIKCLTNLQKLAELQRGDESFNALVERARVVIAGGTGSVQRVDLDLPNCKIVGKGRLLQLLVGEEVRRAEPVPLPILLDGREAWEIGGGSYLIELHRGPLGEYLLRLRRLQLE
jgi:hypothetical protein